MYKVIKFFRDLQDNNHAYHVGEQFPHDGMEVSNDRLAELSTEANRRHEPLIEWVEVEATKVAEEANEDAPKPKKKRGRPRNDAE
jgi:hypothetical protein